MVRFTDFIRSKAFVRHFFLASLVGALLITGMLFWVRNYTRHGKNISVPVIKDKQVKVAENLLSPLTLKLRVIDSIFDPALPRGSIVDQTPAAGVFVKENRTIYVSINSYLPPTVSVPNLKDASFRQAKAILESVGLALGDTSYVPDIAKDAVLGVRCKGRSLAPGTRLAYGTAIVLQLGDGLTGEQLEVPELKGMNYEEAHNILNDLALSAGSEIFDESVSDTAQAVVYKQVPPAGDNNKISKGAPIDLFFTQDASKVK